MNFRACSYSFDIGSPILHYAIRWIASYKRIFIWNVVCRWTIPLLLTHCSLAVFSSMSYSHWESYSLFLLFSLWTKISHQKHRPICVFKCFFFKFHWQRKVFSLSLLLSDTKVFRYFIIELVRSLIVWPFSTLTLTLSFLHLLPFFRFCTRAIWLTLRYIPVEFSKRFECSFILSHS